jgi:hypothetical protein
MTRRNLIAIAGLSLLLFALDQLYRVLHPEVNPIRAGLVGFTALLALAPLASLPRSRIQPWAGALAIFASAFLSVLLIEAGVLVSRSPASGLAHFLILAVAYPLLGGRLESRPTRSEPQASGVHRAGPPLRAGRGGRVEARKGVI